MESLRSPHSRALGINTTSCASDRIMAQLVFKAAISSFLERYKRCPLCHHLIPDNAQPFLGRVDETFLCEECGCTYGTSKGGEAVLFSFSIQVVGVILFAILSSIFGLFLPYWAALIFAAIILIPLAYVYNLEADKLVVRKPPERS